MSKNHTTYIILTLYIICLTYMYFHYTSIFTISTTSILVYVIQPFIKLNLYYPMPLLVHWLAGAPFWNIHFFFLSFPFLFGFSLQSKIYFIDVVNLPHIFRKELPAYFSSLSSFLCACVSHTHTHTYRPTYYN